MRTQQAGDCEFAAQSESSLLISKDAESIADRWANRLRRAQENRRRAGGNPSALGGAGVLASGEIGRDGSGFALAFDGGGKSFLELLRAFGQHIEADSKNAICFDAGEGWIPAEGLGGKLATGLGGFHVCLWVWVGGDCAHRAKWPSVHG